MEHAGGASNRKRKMVPPVTIDLTDDAPSCVVDLTETDVDDVPPDVSYQSGDRGAHKARVAGADQEKMRGLFRKEGYQKWVGGMDNHTKL